MFYCLFALSFCLTVWTRVTLRRSNYSGKRTTRQKSFWALREKVSKWTKFRNKFNKVFEDFAKLVRKGIRKLYGLVSKIVDFSYHNKITKQHGQKKKQFYKTAYLHTTILHTYNVQIMNVCMYVFKLCIFAALPIVIPMPLNKAKEE